MAAGRVAAQVGACSWSCQADGPQALADFLTRAGVSCVQLHLDPVREGRWPEAETRLALERAGISIRSGMMSMRGEDYSSLDSIKRTGGVRPDATWEANRAAAEGNARLAQRLGLGLVTFHAGFLPHARSDRERTVLVARLRELVDVFAAHRVRVGFETGQETADTLLEVLDDLARPAAGVNFDPANLILYGMGEPIEALRKLLPRVVQVHVKDATSPRALGAWGEEVPAGTGEVDWPGFFGALRGKQPGVDCMIEREAGSNRLEDMRTARELVERLR